MNHKKRRILAVIDNLTCECLVLVVDMLPPSLRVMHELETGVATLPCSSPTTAPN